MVVVGLCAAGVAFCQQPKFELADVHSSQTSPSAARNFGGVLRAGKYINRDVTMLGLIEAAYKLKEDAIAGGPGWVASDLFDIIAKVPEGTKMAEANQMLQSLLADRFKLAVKHETQPVPRYVLTVGKGGSKLKPASGSGQGCQRVQQPGGGRGNQSGFMQNIMVECHNLTAAEIADNLRQMGGAEYFDHDLIDETGLSGSFDFKLEWTAPVALVARGADGISLFDAVDKQLGLKLDIKDVPMPVLVIESVNRKPTANEPRVEKELAPEPAKFEAASIKPATPDNQMTGLLYQGGSMMRAGGTLRSLITMSLQVSPNFGKDIVVGLPKFADETRWEINAKVPTTGEGAPNVVNGRPMPPPLSIGLEMLNHLLIDRFGLKTHRERRETTVYVLTAGKGKPKMTAAKDSDRTGCKPAPNAPAPLPGLRMTGCTNTSMAEFAENIQRMAPAYIDHPVVDETGIEGGWNFFIGWTPRPMLEQMDNSNQPVGTAADPTGISFFEALERELGLKLVKQTRMYPVIVVDHIEERPVE
ncbi:MAG TPA: TIGR03435 family protein [Bryobacteraceae bacterium]|nr:TIGR03435 family protein [Bryobacteraceae bacterium]